ncbi:outer membrane protein assembly factor BamA [Candidatus Fermentibacteria bacterium]|nr:MAG: outer membrane protein assembly factor BamA [Candidatus Fermentibacteria bacterium]
MRLTAASLLILAIAVYAMPISDISVEGNGYVSDSLIIRTIGLAAGEELPLARIPGGIRELFALGYFRDINIQADSSSGAASILISVVENPILGSISVENTDCLDEDDIIDTLTIYPGQTVSINDIDRAEDLIVALYSEKNRHLATVSHRWEDADSDGRSNLLFTVSEGPDVRVGEIAFSGNSVFSDEDLRDEMKTKQDSFWRSGKLKPEEFQADLGRIETYYHNRGYPDAAVTGTDRYIMDDGRHFHIDISVSEGPYRVFGQVDFSGNTEVSDSLMMVLSKIEEGRPFSVEKLNTTLENYYSAFQDRGYFYASVEPLLDYPAGADSVVNISFVIQEGERAHIRQVQILGNTRTHDNVIRRELTMTPGDLFRRSDMVRSLRNVYYLNYFNDVVPDFRAIPGTPDVDLIMEVDEKTTGKFGIGTNYSGSDGFSGYLEVAETNFFGRGQNLGASYEFSSKRQNIKLSFTEPWFRDTPLTLGGELYHTTSDYSYYDRQRTGGSVLLGRPLPWVDYTSASIRYTLEKVNVFNITDDPDNYYYSLNNSEWPRWDSSIRLGITRDSQDRKTFPGEGSKNTFSVDLTGGFLGGDIGFQKYLFDSTWHTPLWWKFFLTLRGRLGTIAGFGGETPPAYELFRLGGTGFYGVRGYGDNEINAVEGFDTVGGRAMLILSAEYRFRIIDQLQLAVFTESGNTWKYWSDLDLTTMNRGAGLGIRVEVPMLGIMGLDYAYGFDGPDPGWEPHFQMGATF